MPQNDTRAVNVILNELDARATAAENAVKPTLAALSLAANSITENAASGTVVGGIVGKTTGSTLSLANDDGGRFAISGTNLVAGLTNIDYEAATSRSMVLRETLAGATNSPRDTPLAVGVVNVFEQPSLRALLLSSTSLTIGTPATGTITEAATGSTITSSGLPAGFTINGPARTWAYDGSGPASTPTITLTETLGDSPNSPRATSIGLTIAAATPAITPMPSGVVAMWDPATLALADGATVDSWTDSVGGSAATYTTDTTAKHTFVAATGSGDLPAVRLSGTGVLTTTGTNAANTALTTGAGQGVIVVARGFTGPGTNQVASCLVGIGGSNTNGILIADQTRTGKFGALTDCADAGMRTVGYSATGSTTFMSVNGTMISVFGSAFGQLTIGGWQNVAQRYCGKADILAVIVFNRTVTSADFKQVHRRYCDLLKQAYPGGGTRKTFVALGDSLTYGTGADLKTSWPANIAKALGLPWGTWDNLGVQGMTWNDIRNGTIPSMGDIKGVTGRGVVVGMFEYANMRTQTVVQATSAARAAIDLLRSNDPTVSIVFGTSTDDGSSVGQTNKSKRVEYNNFWDTASNRSGITTYVQIHLDPNIGVDGAAPTNGTANAYYVADNLHLNAGGYVVLDNGPYGFRAPISALLA